MVVTKPSLVDKILELLADITIYEAKQLLGNLEYNYVLDPLVIIDWSARVPQLNTTFNSQYEVVWDRYEFARKIQLQFAGGPPHTYQWYNGTLVTFVCDRMLYYAATHGYGRVRDLLESYGLRKEQVK
jgi:hypothetical protein